MTISMSQPDNRTMDEVKSKLLEQIKASLEKEGIWQAATCPTGGHHGWDVKAHYALEQIQRKPPEGWHVSRTYKFECYDWTVVYA